MTKLEKIEAEIKSLGTEDLRRVSELVAELQNDLWDEQIARDSEAGKLDDLANAALAAHKAGQTKPL